MRTVHDIMTANVLTIHKDKSISEVEGLFVTHRISGAPIVDNGGNMTGVVSNTDLRRFNFTGGDPNYARVWEIASPIVITVEASIFAKDAARMMIDKKIHHLVVTEGQKVVGILTSHDLVKLVAEVGH